MNKIIFILCVSMALLFGCSKTEQPIQKTTLENSANLPESFSGLVKYFYESEGTPEFPKILMYDRYAFLNKYSSEINRTLQLNDSIVTENVAVAFYTYSIGPTNYHGRKWFRKVDGHWHLSISQYFSSYEEDPFNDGMPERAKEIIKKAETWMKPSKNVWWEY